jgi:hypothetical protein
MIFSEWITEQVAINEESLPPKIKKLKSSIEKKIKNTPLIVASDKGRVALLTPDYRPIIDVGMNGTKFVVKTGDETDTYTKESDILELIDTAIETGDVF